MFNGTLNGIRCNGIFNGIRYNGIFNGIQCNGIWNSISQIFPSMVSLLSALFRIRETTTQINGMRSYDLYIGVVSIYAYDNNGCALLWFVYMHNMIAVFWHSIGSVINV